LSKVEVVPYNSDWPKQYEVNAKKIKSALGENCVAIHHVGSTAVPDLPAKPKIDIVAEVKNLGFSYEPLENLGYTYRGSFNLPLRKSFTQRNGKVKVNLHIFEQNDPEVELNLLFRDFLRTHRDAREEYGTLKYNLLQKESSHQKNGSMYCGYTLGKHDFIQKIIEKTGFDRLRLCICTHRSEWESVKKLCLGASCKIAQNPRCFILYQGTEIIGCAQIPPHLKSRTDIQTIVMDREKQSFKEPFLQLIEKWIHSSPSSSSSYSSEKG